MQALINNDSFEQLFYMKYTDALIKKTMTIKTMYDEAFLGGTIQR